MRQVVRSFEINGRFHFAGFQAWRHAALEFVLAIPPQF
jgi:hypothetical protein